jgi:hypothetical protein
VDQSIPEMANNALVIDTKDRFVPRSQCRVSLRELGQARGLPEHIIRDRVHRLLVIVRLKQMPIAVHCHLQAAVTGKSLGGLGAVACPDPAEDRKAP